MELALWMVVIFIGLSIGLNIRLLIEIRAMRGELLLLNRLLKALPKMVCKENEDPADWWKK